MLSKRTKTCSYFIKYMYIVLKKIKRHKALACNIFFSFILTELKRNYLRVGRLQIDTFLGCFSAFLLLTRLVDNQLHGLRWLLRALPDNIPTFSSKTKHGSQDTSPCRQTPCLALLLLLGTIWKKELKF